MSYLFASNLAGKFIAILCMVTVAFFVNEMPTSSVLQSIFPDWPFLVVLILSVSEKWKTTPVLAFIVGLFQDLFLGTPLGMNAFIYTMCSYIISQYRKRFKYAGLMFQTFVVSALVLLKVVLALTVNSFIFALPQYFWSLLSIPLSMFAWVIISWLGLLFKKDIS